MNRNDDRSAGRGARPSGGVAKQEIVERSLPGRYLHTAATLGAGIAKGALSYHELADLPFEYARRHVKPHGWARRALDSMEDEIPGMAFARPILKSKTYQQFQNYAKPENAFEYILNAGGEQVPDAVLAAFTGGGAVLTKMAAKQVIKRLAKEAAKEVLVSGVPSGLARWHSPESKLLDMGAQFTGSTMSKARAAEKVLRKQGSGAVDHYGLAKDIASDAAKKGVMYAGEQAARRLPAEQGQTPPGVVPGPVQQERQTQISTLRDSPAYPYAPWWPGGRPFPWQNGQRWRDGTRGIAEIADEYMRRAGGDEKKAVDLLKQEGWL